MHSTTRKFVSLVFAATAFMVVTSLADWKLGFAQQFENPAATRDRARPEPASLTETDAPDAAIAREHSILFEETASQIPALRTQPQTETIQLPISSPSPVADDPFTSADGIRRVAGTGEEAVGTFATSDNMPIANQGFDSNRTYSGTSQYGAADQQYQLPPENQSTSPPPITSNGLRGTMLTPQTTGQSSNFSKMRFGDSEFGDQQPQPPQAEPGRQSPRASEQNRSLPQQPVSSTFNDNQFNGPPANAPPIHSVPQGAWDNTTQLPQQLDDHRTIYDSNISPTQYQQSSNNNSTNQQSTTAKVDLSLARKIMTRYEIDNAPDPLPGRPVKLVDVLQTTPRNLQKKVITQYWETFFDWATVLNSAQLTDWLNQLPSPQNASELALLNAARAAARNKMLSDEIQLGKSQCKLQQLMGSKDELLPLPSDQPLLQTYDTHYEWYESRNRLPEDLRGIDVMLSKSVQLISNRASTVGTTRVALSQIRNGYAQNPRELGSILNAARLWNEAEQDLVWSIVNYNQAIADYSLSISPASSQPDQIVAMLIAKPKPAVAQQETGQNSGSPSGTTGQISSSMQSNLPRQNDSQSRFQNASQPQSQFGQNRLPRQNSGGYDRGDDPISRTMNSGSSLSPNGFSNQPSGSRQPSSPPSQPNTFQSPQYSPTNQGQPNTFQPNSSQPQANPGDRSAFRGSGQSFGGGNRSGFSPPSSGGMSESAKEFNSFPR